MKKLFVFLFAVGILLCLTACGSSDKDTGIHVSITDVAAEAVSAGEIVPANVDEVAIATAEMILVQPMEQPAAPASGEPSSEAVEETTTPVDAEE